MGIKKSEQQGIQREEKLRGTRCQSSESFCFVFVALHPMSTAMVIAGRSDHLTTLFPGQA